MSIQSEPNWAGEAFVRQPGEHGFEAVTVLSGQNLGANMVVGKVSVSGVGGLAIPAVVGTGNGTMTGLTAGPNVQVGNYVITCTAAAANGGTFSVVAPDGTVLDSATVGTAYASDHLSFTLNDGSTDFIVTDSFTVAVAASTTATVVGTGNGTVTSVSVGPLAQRGTYLVKLTAAVTNGGVVEVVGPNGEVVEANSITAGASGTLVVTSPQINLTVTDGSTDFAKGDIARIVVFGPAANPKVVAWDPQATDGRQNVAGVLRYAVDASSADTAGVIANGKLNPVLNGSKLAWIATASAADKVLGKAGLTNIGFVVAANV